MDRQRILSRLHLKMSMDFKGVFRIPSRFGLYLMKFYLSKHFSWLVEIEPSPEKHINNILTLTLPRRFKTATEILGKYCKFSAD